MTPQNTRKIFSVVHSTMVEQPSSFTHFIKKRVEITIPDIDQLTKKIYQYMSNYDIINHSEIFQVRMEGGEFIKFSNKREFLSFDESQSAAVENVSLTLDYLIISPKSEKPFTFKIEVEFRKIDPFFQTELIEVPDMISANIRLQIEHSDYIIARSLKSHIDEWVQSLKETSINRFLKFSHYYVHSVHPRSTSIIGLGVSLAAAVHFSNKFPAIESAGIALSFFVAVFFVLKIINGLLSGVLTETVAFCNSSYAFNITRGDKVKIEKYNKKSEKINLYLYFIFTVILINILCSIFSSYIFSFLEPFIL